MRMHSGLARLIGFFALAGVGGTGLADTPRTESAPPTAALEGSTGGARLPSELTVGFQVRESETEGIGDLLVPLWSPGGNGLLFLNPRTAMTDHDGKEVNIGLGYRHLLADQRFILGANLYYDYRDTGYSHYDQWGVGLEFLSHWVDGRVNYYDPESKQFVVGRRTEARITESLETVSGYGDPYARGNLILQNYSTTQTKITTLTERAFEQYEQALGGYDWEVGVRLPLPYLPDAVETRLFGGYYHFERDFGNDAKGWKARAELRLRSTLFLDAGVYENEDLTGSEWFVGARLSVPFELDAIAKGRNPFAVMPNRWNAGVKPLSTRLTEMVMRDPQIQLEVSGLVENKARFKEEVSTKVTVEKRPMTVMVDVNFVDGDAASAGDGTAERPFTQIQDGVDNAFGQLNVYVYDASSAYLENVVLSDGVNLWGSGALIPVSGKRYFGSGTAPVVDGMSMGPTIAMANQTSIRGFHIRNTDMGAPPQEVALPGDFGNADISRVGIFGDNVTDLAVIGNHIAGNREGTLFSRQGDFNLLFSNNRVSNNDGSGVWVAGAGNSGTFSVLVEDSQFTGNGRSGIEVMAGNYDMAFTYLRNSEFSNNGWEGAYILHMDTFVSTVLASGLQANGNDWEGLYVHQRDNLISLANLSDITADNNDGGVYLGQESDLLSIGIIGMPAGLGSLAGLPLPDGLALFLEPRGGVTASGNTDDGVAAEIRSEALALGAFFDITANQNEGDGLNALVESELGIAVGLAGSSQTLAEGLQFVSDLAGFLDLDLPLEIQGGGQMQLNNNSENGLSLGVYGGLIGVAGVAGVESSGNTQWGSAISSEGGLLGMAMAARVVSLANGAGGIGLNAEAENIAIGLLADVNASGTTGGGGIDANVDSEGISVLLTLSTDALRPLAGVLGEEFLGEPYALPGTPFGPVMANHNAGTGFSAAVNGDSLAAAFILDTQANHNDGHGFEVDVTSLDGTAIGAFVSSDLLYDLLPALLGIDPVPDAGLGWITANDNVRNGIQLNVHGEYGAAAVIAGVEAYDNELRDGLDVTLTADNGGAQAYFVGVDSDGNGTHGIDLSIAAEYGVQVGFVDVWADDNAGRGMRIAAESASEDVIVLLANANARGNEGSGLHAELTALNGDAALAITDSQMSYNEGRGATVQMTAGDDAYLFVGDTAGFDLDDVFGFSSGLGGLENFIPAGSAEFSHNGSGGLRADITSNDGDVIAVINNADANQNQGMGMNLQLEALNGDINALVRASGASWNDGNGIRVDMDGAAGTAALALDGVTTADNEGNGIMIVENYNGNVAIQGHSILSAYNEENGVRVVTSGMGPSLIIDFGGGALGSPGLNAFIDNGNRDFRYNNGGGATAFAQENWWGVAPPVAGQFAGNVDWSNWLVVDPNAP